MEDIKTNVKEFTENDENDNNKNKSYNTNKIDYLDEYKRYELLIESKELDKSINFNRAKYLSGILQRLYIDNPTKIAASLLNFIRSKELNFDDIKDFPEEVINLLKKVLEMDKYDSDTREGEFEMLRNMLVAIAKDIRVIMIKLADILYLANNLDIVGDLEKRKQLHKQIGEIYAPLSARLGFTSIKSELQNLNLEFLKPEEYNKLKKELTVHDEGRRKQIDITTEKLRKLCKGINIANPKIYGRVKNISSIYNKLQDKHCLLNNIYDLTAVRVICDTVEECYKVSTGITSIYKSIDGRYKDYIANPKANGYRSLHVTVIADNGEPLEIQIRTREMHDFAEYGVAAHWLYKEKKSKRNLVEEKLTEIRKLVENTSESTLDEILESLKTEVYLSEIYVQTPKGKIISLVDGANPIDFAYHIHGDIGDKCVGAKINGKMMPLNTPLSNGDVVEIITNQQSKGPSRDWLKIVKTTLARKQINQFFKREMQEENIRNGRIYMENYCKTRDLHLNELITEKYLNEVFERYSLKSENEMYASVGYGTLTASQVVNKLLSCYNIDNKNKIKESTPIQTIQTQSTELKQRKKENKELENSNNLAEKNAQTMVLVEGKGGILCRLANCCRPQKGSNIVGFISHSRGVTIHSADCVNIKGLNKNRLIKVSWMTENTNFYAHIGIKHEKMVNSIDLLNQIITILKDVKSNIRDISTRKKGIYTYINLEIFVRSEKMLDNIIARLGKIKDVKGVTKR